VRKRPHWAFELLVVAFLLVIYDVIAGQAHLRADAAIAHGRDMLALSPEGFELSADRWLASVRWLRDPASLYYDLAHIDVTLAVLVAGFVWRGEVYRRARTALVSINLIGLVVFFLYPVAPPRLLPGAGFVDIVGLSGTWQSSPASVQHSNAFGSMPSLHSAWAVWVALTVMAMTSRRWLHGLAWLHVALTFVFVVLTGNHYVIDIVAGIATALVAWALAPSLNLRWTLRSTEVSQEVHRERAAVSEPS
jgi:hypothetical protein